MILIQPDMPVFLSHFVFCVVGFLSGSSYVTHASSGKYKKVWYVFLSSLNFFSLKW